MEKIKQSGNFSISRRTTNLYDLKRDHTVSLQICIPAAFNQSQVPVSVISNGLGGHLRSHHTLLAQHLASQGFVVFIPDHFGSNDHRPQHFFAGLDEENFDAKEDINRPLDITHVLNELEKCNQIEFENKLNLQQAGIFGYFFSGTTALAGAKLDFKQLEQDCILPVYVVNISILYQCRALELLRQTFNLQDGRIKAAFVFIPFSNSLFGKNGLSRVNIPIFWQATDEAIVTPLSLEHNTSF